MVFLIKNQKIRMIFIVSIGRAKDIENSLIDEYFIGNDFYKGKIGNNISIILI
jgi:hypothetical protein